MARGPRDSLGRPARPLRYSKPVRAKISDDAYNTLQEMAERRRTKVGTLIRRAVMKEVYIYKAKQNQAAEAEDGEDETAD